MNEKGYLTCLSLSTTTIVVIIVIINYYTIYIPNIYYIRDLLKPVGNLSHSLGYILCDFVFANF